MSWEYWSALGVLAIAQLVVWRGVVARAKATGAWQSMFAFASSGSDGVTRMAFSGLDPVQLFVDQSMVELHGGGVTADLEQTVITAPNLASDSSRLEQVAGLTDVILSRWDFDGFVSTALLRRKLTGATVRYLSPSRLAVELTRLANDPLSSPPDRIVIADLGVSGMARSQELDQLETALEALLKNGTAIYWYDHHLWADEAFYVARDRCQDLVVDEEHASAAAIIAARHFPGDEAADFVVRMVEHRLTAGPEQALGDRWMTVLEQLLRQSAPELREEVLERLATNAPLSLTERAILRRSERRTRRVEALARLTYRRELTSRGRSFLVLDFRPRRIELDAAGHRLHTIMLGAAPHDLGPRAARRAGVDFFLVAAADAYYGLYRTSGGGVSFSRLFDLYRLGAHWVRFEGHDYGCGIHLSGGARRPLRRLWDWRLPAEAEELIAILKERF